LKLVALVDFMPLFFADFMTWNPDPEIFKIGPLAIRYYSLLFVACLLLGNKIWMMQSERLGYDLVIADKWLMWGVLAVVIGSRLGHCFFYEPAYYFSHPLEILKVWKGGLASHGATVGLIVTLWLYGRRYSIPWIETLDRMAIPVTMAATFVRLGNFMNSEIVGRVTDVSWAVRFPRHDGVNALPRHPSQLYEAALGVAVFVILSLIDRAMPDNGRRRGVLTAGFFFLYFTGRFFVEYTKEYQSLHASFPFTMGQMLSVPFVLGGLVVLGLSLSGRLGTLKVPAATPSAAASAGGTVPPRQGSKSSKSKPSGKNKRR
jgi:phosphatidylglycerol---prolipoprotein diacylglyceryl transferase